MNQRFEFKRVLARFALEVAIYMVLVVVYLALVFRFFAAELVALFHTELVLYAGLALSLIVFQGFFLEAVTSFLVDRLNL